MSDKYVVTPEEHHVPAAKQGKGKSCMRHCKRFWWAYLCLFIVIVVLAVCLM